MRTRRTNGGGATLNRKLLYSAVAAACVVPSTVWSQTPLVLEEVVPAYGLVELGAGHVDSDSFRFGDYTGLHRKGLFLQAHVLWGERNPDTGTYWRLSGTNLGLRSRNIRVDAGRQGAFGAFFEFDQLPKFRWDTTRTPFLGVGGPVLTLPPGWVAGANTAGMTQLGAALRPFDVKSERKNYIGGVSGIFAQNWEARARFRHERKDGTKLVGAVIGNSGGNPRAVLIPEPTDYETNEFEASIGYADPTLQFQIGYYLSLFNNQHDGLIWQNPFAQIGGWAPGVGFPTGQGRLGLPPDNRFHQINASGGYNINPFTRLSGTVALGRMTQDQTFLPYTVNPLLAVTTPLPRPSLDGRIDTTLVNLNLSSRPITGLHLRASYRYDDRDNKTPQNQYLYIGGDSQNQVTTLASDRARTNLPLSYRQNLIRLDADYEVLPRTRVNAGYDFEEVKRTLTEVDRTKENTYRVGLRHHMMGTVDGAVSYSHSRRTADNYIGNLPFILSYSPQYQALPANQPPGNFDNHPLIRKFNYADRDRDRLRLTLNASPHPMVGVQLRADYNKDDFRNSVLGLTDSRSQAYTIDASFTPRQNVVTYAFYTHERYDSDQRGRTFTTAAGPCNKISPNILTPGPSTCDWFAFHDDRIHTVGVGTKLTNVARWEFGADYMYSHGRGKINVVTPVVGQGIALPALPLPDLVTRLHSFRAHARYQLQKNTAVRLSFVHERLRSADWAWDGVAPATIANVLTTGQESPRYSVNVVGVSLIYRFR
jgi:MtrB/PioB family decaheme-associated outer membrane protein